ncbi:Protein ras-2 [Mycena venus]|uniref:Protein ras-2 n=1 Tax=Mycena venus TaxID=2733690 RepID=A0A8H6X738_9AGAR|nr:Protein ras-2 [Mycena venus]
MDQWTLAVLGDGAVGKTALAVQVSTTGARFPSRLRLPSLHSVVSGISIAVEPHMTAATKQVSVQTYDPTLEDCYRKQFIVDNRLCFVDVIDTAGQDEYATLRDQWVREGQGFLLVYSITSRLTFDRLEVFHRSMTHIKGAGAIFLLVGNKSDLRAQREVSEQEGAALARKYGCKFIEVSAKTGQNVEHTFSSLVRALRATKEPAGQPKPVKTKRGCIIL